VEGNDSGKSGALAAPRLSLPGKFDLLLYERRQLCQKLIGIHAVRHTRFA